MAKWMACVPNISEGRRRDVIDAVAAAARDVANVYVQHVDSDPDHNRTVLTLTGAPPAVADAAFRVVREAATRIDMRAHEGEHPRLGAADVVPFVPLSGVTLSDCARVAGRFAEWIEAELGIPAYLWSKTFRDARLLVLLASASQTTTDKEDCGEASMSLRSGGCVSRNRVGSVCK